MLRPHLPRGMLLALVLHAGCQEPNESAEEQRDGSSAVVDGGAPGSVPKPGMRGLGEPRACQPGSGVLVGAERELARSCQGECAFDLSIVYPIVLGKCTAPQVSLSVLREPTMSDPIVVARLTLEAWQRAVDLGLALREEAIDPAYGDPYGDGREVATLVLDQPRAGLIDTSYGHGSPPPVLAEADAFMQGLIDQMRACEGPDLVDCQR